MTARSFVVGVLAAIACVLFVVPVSAQSYPGILLAQAPPANRPPPSQQGGSTLTESARTRLAVPLGDKQEVQGLPDYINTVYRYMLGIVTIVAIIMVIYGAFLFLLSHGDAKKASDGQRVIKDALGGMAVLFLAYFILYNVNPRTTRLDLVVTPVRSIAIQDGSHDVTPGRSCLKDADCTNGAKCLRTSAFGGICADGRPGNICKCRGAGCQVTAEQAGGPTNNNGTNQIQCQAGAECQEIQANEWVCNGGEAMACNMSTRYVWDPNVQDQNLNRAGDLAGRVNNAGAAVGDFITPPGMGLAGRTAGRVVAAPFSALVAVGSLAANGVAARERQAVSCTNGRTCFQRSEQAAGACVYGDHRDMVMINNIPEERRNTLGILRNIERCDFTVENLRALPFPQGGCKNLTNDGVDEFCVQHRYRCASGAVCTRTEFSGAFTSTIAQYRSMENAPVQLRPEYFFKQGCRKPAGQSCASDNECAGKCLSGRCTGVGVIATSRLLQPGALRFGQLPNAEQIDVHFLPNGSCNDSWSFVQLLLPDHGSPSDRERTLQQLFSSGTPDRFVCYPKRGPDEACDFNEQCRSNECIVSGNRPPVPATYANPTDVRLGAGQCI